MKILIASLFLVLGWLIPYHKTPWPTFSSEVLTFLSASLLLLSFYKQKIDIPRPQLIAIPLLSIPLLQLATGQILYASNAILCFTYVLIFWLMVVAGFNLSTDSKQREKLFSIFSLIVLVVGLISSFIAICQWLNINGYFSPWMYTLKGNRPYANLAQPNNLATLLIISFLGCLYLFEKRSIKNLYLIPISLIILFGIVLAQSRTSLVVCVFLTLYWLVKTFRSNKRLSNTYFLGWVVLFILLTLNLSYLSQLILTSSSVDISTNTSAAERAVKGMGDIRVDMWYQMWVAVMQQPWFGYGWNQTGLAQYYVMEIYQVPLWYKSAHNILLDILVWNGAIIGGLIVVYLTVWLFWLNKGVKDTVSIVATLMVCAILIHGLLEFPLHYAYFLLPAGFLLGIIQAQYKNLPTIQVGSKITSVIAIVCIVGCAVSVRDYFLYKEQSSIASLKTPLTASQQQVMDKDIILLTQFKERIWWIQLNPKTKMNEEQLAHIERMVANMSAKYDLYKHAQVLAFNGKEQQARHQLWVLETLHHQKRAYEDLLK